jgi:hypothetical protein
MLHQLAADLVLLTHFAIVLFVLLGLPVILIGNARAWPWVNSAWWRLPHLAAIATVVAQAWLGKYCMLTHWESSLRTKAGQVGYESSFIQHWVQALLYFDVPLWVFACVYTAFGALVLWACWRYPPRIRKHTAVTGTA